MFLLFNMLSRFVIAFLPRSKCLLISWLQSPSVALVLSSVFMMGMMVFSHKRVAKIKRGKLMSTYFATYKGCERSEFIKDVSG